MHFGRRQPRLQRAVPASPPAAAVMQPSDTVQRCANAATDIVALLLEAHTGHGRLQAGPVIAAAAALTGEFARCASGRQIGQPGAVPDRAVDDLLFAGAPEGRPTAWMFIMHAAREAGVAAYELPPIETLAATFDPTSGAAALLRPAEETYLPRELLLNIGPRFRHKIVAIADAHDLTLRDVTLVLGAATGQLILRTQHDLAPRAAVTLAAETMLMTGRTAPLAEAVTPDAVS